jgi:hypothetical protein
VPLDRPAARQIAALPSKGDAMHGPPLTSQEVTRLVRRKVRQFEEIGLPRAAAIRATAGALQVAPDKIETLALDEAS